MKRDPFIARRKIEQEEIRQREKAVETIKKYYAGFSEKVLNMMLRYALRKRGVQSVLKKLGLQVAEPDEDKLHTAILQWIFTNGERRFLEILEGGENRAPSKTPAADSSRDNSPKVPAAASQVPQEKPQEKIWQGIERRSGKDRRQLTDRRKDVVTIFKNRRFGGERRSGKERRKNWKSA